MKPVTKRDFLALEFLQKNIHGLELWENGCDPECKTRILVPKDSLDMCESFLRSEKVQFKASTEDSERYRCFILIIFHDVLS